MAHFFSLKFTWTVIVDSVRLGRWEATALCNKIKKSDIEQKIVSGKRKGRGYIALVPCTCAFSVIMHQVIYYCMLALSDKTVQPMCPHWQLLLCRMRNFKCSNAHSMLSYFMLSDYCHFIWKIRSVVTNMMVTMTLVWLWTTKSKMLTLYAPQPMDCLNVKRGCARKIYVLGLLKCSFSTIIGHTLISQLSSLKK